MSFLKFQNYHSSRDSSQSSTFYLQHLVLCQKYKNKIMNKWAQVIENQKLKTSNIQNKMQNKIGVGAKSTRLSCKKWIAFFSQVFGTIQCQTLEEKLSFATHLMQLWVSYATKKCHMCSCIRQVAKDNFFTNETTLFTFELTLVSSIHHHITVCLTLSLKASLHYFLSIFTHFMPSTSLYNSCLHSLACWMYL